MGRGQDIEVLRGLRQAPQRRDVQVVEHGAPGGGVVRRIQAHDVGFQRGALRPLRVDRRADDPAFGGGRLHRGGQGRQHGGAQARDGVDARDRLLESGAGAAEEHAHAGRPQRLGGAPSRDGPRVRHRFQPGIGALGQRHAGDAGARLVHQGPVERHGGHAAGQQRGQVPGECGAGAVVGGAGQARGPVLREPGFDRGAVQRPGPAQHQIEPRRLVQPVGLAERAAHLRLRAPDQAGQQRVLEGVPVGGLGAGAEFLVLVETQSVVMRRLRRGDRVCPASSQGSSAAKSASPTGSGMPAASVMAGPGLAGSGAVSSLVRAASMVCTAPCRRVSSAALPSTARRTHAPKPPRRSARRRRAAPGRKATSGASGKHDVVQQVGQEVGAACSRLQARRPFLVQPEGAREPAGQAVDGRALLRAGCQVDAAQQRRPACRVGAEAAAEEGVQAGQDAGHLAGKSGDRGQALGRRLDIQAAIQAAVQPVQQGVEQAVEDRAGWGQRQGRAPDLRPAGAVQVVEELAEAGQQVRLGQQQVDRESHAEGFVQLVDARADGDGVRRLGRPGPRRSIAGGHDVPEGDRDQHAVERLLGAGAAQQGQEGLPARAVDRRVAVLRRVAPGGVDQDSGLGEPPLAQARAAHARDRARPQRAIEREAEAGVQQCGGLAGAGGADDGVPGLLVQQSAALGLAQQRQGLGQAALHGGGLVLRGGAHAVGQLRLLPGAAPVQAQVGRHPRRPASAAPAKGGRAPVPARAAAAPAPRRCRTGPARPPASPASARRTAAAS